MCQIPTRPSPLQTIIEVSELLQEFLKHAALDGFIESWCLEITLQSGANDIPEELSVDYMHHLIGLHSLNYLILKRLDGQHHDTSAECCSCGWEISHIPEFLHTDIDRYTPGTIIRWSQGECHVLLAPTADGYNPVNPEAETDQCSESEEPNPPTEDGSEIALHDIQPAVSTAEDEHVQRSGVIQSTEFANSVNEEQQIAEQKSIDSPHKSVIDGGLKHHLKQVQFCRDDSELKTNDEDAVSHPPQDFILNSSSWSRVNNDNAVEDSFINGISDDEENSRMLVINEDDNSQDTKTFDKKETDTSDPSASPVQVFSFHNVLPLTTENVRAHSREKRCSSVASQREEDDKNDDDDNDDDSSSVSSSSSSSSTSTSSSSTSSDDDDRINFKNRVEQAAQAAREAAAAANTITSFQDKPVGETSVISTNIVPVASEEYNYTTVPSSFPSLQFTPTSSFAVFRHPDDIQAAQGLAALGKGHEFLENVINNPESNEEPSNSNVVQSPFKNKTCKIAEKLLQNENVEVIKLGPKNFQCGVCGKLYVRLAKALEHNITHRGEKPWECDSCDKKFAKHYTLQKHKRAKHSTDRKYNCNICNKSFGGQSELQSHMSTHTGIKPYACSVCGQRFTLKFTRDTHEAQHTGNRPWCCDLCGKTFITKYKLRAHIRGHTGEYFCSVCNSSFTSQDSFNRHKKRNKNSKTHESRFTKTKLNNCKQNSKQVENITKDVNKLGTMTYSSSSSSSFRCQMCNKMFEKSADLTYHLSSCNAITYCPPPNMQAALNEPPPPPPPPPPPSILTECSSTVTSQPLSLHPQTESSMHGQPMTSCMLDGEKKMSQFTPCPTPGNVPSSMESLERRAYLMQSMDPIGPYQHQDSILQQGSNPVPEGLPDYLNEVAFGGASGSTPTIIYQPSHG